MFEENYKLENVGSNAGVMVGSNSGIINLNYQKATRMPSLISKIVMRLGDACLDDVGGNGSNIPQEFRPDDKIEYNCVKRYKYIIQEFSSYYTICDTYMNSYDDSNIRGKARILKCIHLWYLKAKGEIISQNQAEGKTDIDIIRDNADLIIYMVNKKIQDAVKESEELDSMQREEMDLGIACFSCYCFMECKILEKPS